MLLNKRPPDAPETNSQRRPGPNLRAAAAAATPEASNASKTGEPLGLICPNDGSNRRATATNWPARKIAFALKRRSQPRTVDAGTPNRPAIGRRPSP